VAVFPVSGTSAAELLEAARRAARGSPTGGKVTTASPGVEIPEGAEEPVIVSSPAMRQLHEVVKRVARTPVPVLLLGETGVGKEVVARALHRHAGRGARPLVTVNCGAIAAGLTESTLFGHERGAFTGADRQAKGLFEQAHGGTLLLDEVGELPPSAQAALLRVLETKKLVRIGSHQEIAVDVRVVAATHRDLDAMVAEGKFRSDLLFRLNAVTLSIPPLRERPEEIPDLCTLFIRSAAGSWGMPASDIDPEALAVLSAYSWPGNVRELRNAMERAVAIAAGHVVMASDLPERIQKGVRAPAPRPGPSQPPAPEDGRDFKEQMRAFEARVILDALEETAGNQSRAAELLGLPLRTLVHKIRALGISKVYGKRE